MSFESACNIVITGGTFLFCSNITPGALHNSAERFDPPKCHANTRTAILDDIITWLKDKNAWAQIMWLYGSAGVGKSAIAQTLSELCWKSGSLVASFFFSRGVQNRHSETPFIATLAYQLMKSFPEAREIVLDAVANDPSIFSLSLDIQMQLLIINPINSAALDEVTGAAWRSRAPYLIVVDGLDECDSSEEHRHILNLLFSLITQLTIPISVFVSCRPEQVIREVFNDEPLSSFTKRINLDNFTDDTDIDIRSFLQSEFQKIKINHPAGSSIPSQWPSKEEMSALMMHARGHFIYASTVMKYVGSRRHSPTMRLSYILEQTVPSSDAPFAALDALYRHILLGVDNLENVFKILVVLFLVNHTLVSPTAAGIEIFYSLQPGMVDIALCDLHSVIYVSKDRNEPLRIYHASFSDFLFDEARSGLFFFDPAAARATLASATLHIPINSTF
ncbi:hypothetical protein JR316_0002841 [Psilocybe cubensis]|uniref:Uncharacterized protein n=1 Tax=Psilocybe cubensis TaxID=181762 RepID=A0ACB8HE10_PSICU|nr:hypothetical protein JR316_0002841 [Psilocybe cubensis]KAH9485924.1 hypothetical protein JR316_0002841 [Psilocybe cubensis]